MSSNPDNSNTTHFARRTFLGGLAGSALVGLGVHPTAARAPTDSAYSGGKPPKDSPNCNPTLEELTKVLPDDIDISDSLGRGVAIDGDTAMVGTSLAENDSDEPQGRVYVLQRKDGLWTLTQRLIADFGPYDGSNRNFGSCIDLDGDVALVNGAGEVFFIFELRGDRWVQTARLVPPDPAEGFALRDGVAVFTTQIDDSGVLQIFERRGIGKYNSPSTSQDQNKGQDKKTTQDPGTRRSNDWVFRQRLEVDVPPFSVFGSTVDLEGDTIVVGARDVDPTGAVYVFRQRGRRWVEHQILTPTGATPNSFFGVDVAIQGKTVIVGAPLDSEAAPDAGAAYIFERTGSGKNASFNQQQKLLVGDAAQAQVLGDSVDIADCLAVVGAWRDDDNGADAGAAYVFRREGDSWVEHQKLTASDGEAGDAFSQGVCAVAIDNETVIVGSQNDDNEQGGNAGAAYIYGESQR